MVLTNHGDLCSKLLCFRRGLLMLLPLHNNYLQIGQCTLVQYIFPNLRLLLLVFSAGNAVIDVSASPVPLSLFLAKVLSSVVYFLALGFLLTVVEVQIFHMCAISWKPIGSNRVSRK
jgi:hypothetical protein